MTGRYYEEFEVGETIEHPRTRTISEADNQRFCDMTMNQQPLHLDAKHAAGTDFGERIVNGLYDGVEHPNPVFHGDTVGAETTVTDRRETSDGERGVVTMHVTARKQDGTVVCEFDRTALSLKREHATE